VTSVLCFAIFRAATLAAAMFAAYGSRLGDELAHRGLTAVTAPWQQWDANWYTSIARVGYGPLSPVHTPGGHVYDALVWPPAFPGLIAAISRTFGFDPGAAALLIASVCLLIALIGVYRVVQLQFGEGRATATLVLLLVFPSAFFLGAGYTEALLLATIAWSFWAATTHRWWLAGLLSALALLTKYYAIILPAALLVEYMAQRQWSWRDIRADIAWLVLPPALALGAWATYVQANFGDASRIVTTARYWDRHLAPPWVAALDAASTLRHLRFVGVVDLGSLLLLVGAVIYGARAGRRGYTALMLLAVAVYLSTSTLASTSRYTTVMFPMFLAAAIFLRGRPWLTGAVAAVSAPLMLLMLSRFATGHWAG
jgi:hypothetical protein